MSSQKEHEQDPEGSCLLNRAENFAKASLGLLDPEVKEDLWKHAMEDCSDCLNLWLETSSLMEQLKLKELSPLIKAYQHNKEQSKTESPEKIKEEKLPELTHENKTLQKVDLTQPKIKKNIFHLSNLIRLTPPLACLFLTLLICLPFYKYYKANTVFSSIPKEITGLSVVNDDLNPYEQLDLFIDDYLWTENKKDLSKAETIALEIKKNKGDNYGIDLVKYYRTVKITDFGKLASLRKELKDSEKSAFSANDSERHISKVIQMEEEFVASGNILESYRAKCLLAKTYLLTSNPAYEFLLDRGISYAESNNYLFLKAHFLLWKAKGESNDLDEVKAKERLEEVLTLSKTLQLNDIIPTLTMSLAGVYQKHGENNKALEISEEALNIPPSKYTTTIALLHVAGMASFGLGKYDLSDKYFQEAIVLAQQYKDSFNLSLSYSLAGSLAGERSNFVESQELLAKAEKAANDVRDERPKAHLIVTAKGYEAKIQLKQGNYLEASLLYKEALLHLKKIGIEANLLEASQLNEGLAVALGRVKSKDSGDHYAVAKYLFRESGAKIQEINCLLSFLPGQCN
jgi:tetratricopeptide (TPR) repeat protein